MGVAVGGARRRGGARRGAHQHRQEVEVSLLELSRSRTRSMWARTIPTGVDDSRSLIGRTCIMLGEATAKTLSGYYEGAPSLFPRRQRRMPPFLCRDEHINATRIMQLRKRMNLARSSWCCWPRQAVAHGTSNTSSLTASGRRAAAAVRSASTSLRRYQRTRRWITRCCLALAGVH